MTKIRITSATLFGAGLAAVASGCGASEPPLTPASGTLVERTYYPESAPPVTGTEGREGAIFELTRARCDFEWRCLNVGVDRKYPHLDSCKYQLNTLGYEQLDEDACPSGVSRATLQSCVQSIDQLTCEDSVGDLDDIANCDQDDLCS